MSVRRFLLVEFSSVFFLFFIVHFYAHVTMMYRLVWAEINMLQANSRFVVLNIRSWHVSIRGSNADLNQFTFN